MLESLALHTVLVVDNPDLVRSTLSRLRREAKELWAGDVAMTDLLRVASVCAQGLTTFAAIYAVPYFLLALLHPIGVSDSALAWGVIPVFFCGARSESVSACRTESRSYEAKDY